MSLDDEFKECFEELCSEDEAYGFKRGFLGKESLLLSSEEERFILFYIFLIYFNSS